MNTPIKIDLTGTTLIDIHINRQHSWELSLEHFQDDGITPIPLTGTYKMGIAKKHDASDQDMVAVLANGSGITIDNHKLIISREVIANLLPEGTFYFDIRCDYPDDSSLLPYKGRLFVEGSITAR
jgi:hypothetical protein